MEFPRSYDCTDNPTITTLGHLRGLQVGYKHSYNWVFSIKYQVNRAPDKPKYGKHTISQKARCCVWA